MCENLFLLMKKQGYLRSLHFGNIPKNLPFSSVCMYMFVCAEGGGAEGGGVRGEEGMLLTNVRFTSMFCPLILKVSRYVIIKLPCFVK